MGRGSYVVHPCAVPVHIAGWPTPGMRPLNLDAGHVKCPYCGNDLHDSVVREYPKDHCNPHGEVKNIVHLKGNRGLTDEEYAVLRGGAKD